MRRFQMAQRIALLLGFTAVACGGGADDRWKGTQRDSAGIAIVENPAEGIWTTEEIPTFQEEIKIGSAAGEAAYQFGMITGIDVDAAGRIYVLDQQARRVRIFDPAGKFVSEMGGAGEGPGEQSPVAMGIFVAPGDTVLVMDMQLMRVNRYLPDGTAMSSTPLAIQTEGIPIRWEQMPDLRLVQQARMNAIQGPANPAVTSAPMKDLLLVRGTDGAVRDTLMELPAGASFSFQGGQGQIRLFADEPVWAVDGNGRVAFGMNSEYRIELRSEDGTVERILTKPFTREPVTEADKEAFKGFLKEMWMQTLPPQARRPEVIDRLLGMIQFGDKYPAYYRMLGGPNGSLWVQHLVSAKHVQEAGGEFDIQNLGSPDWDVFDSQGRFLGVIRTPDKFQPMVVAGQQIYGVWRDADDVQHVLRLKVQGDVFAVPTEKGN
jgi:hypothetical protein